MNTNKDIGARGERMAENYLIKNGYQIIARNFYCSKQEIDIIAKDGEYLVFVEVKTRTNWKFGRAEDTLDEMKLNNLRKAISRYLMMKNIDTDFIRLDFIAINLIKAKKQAQLIHIKEVF